uniref:Zinc finger translocation associated n=1 Tax=Cynoglossus semilaevis TaxID=244447 RepID=A0A3P8W5J7_CYNSE
MRSEHVGVVTCCCCGCETVKSRYGATDTVTEGGRRGGVSRAAGAADGRARVLTPITCSGTSYWSITEGPDQPLLLSPAPGPSTQKAKIQRASRPGLSRIPGRDHRRYYHEYWRSEYLMDFDPQRHGMICMVCGSSLATLKLSTIKRHIRQKHPDSLLWSDTDKEVIRMSWESHLSLSGGQRSLSPAVGPPAQEAEEQLELSKHRVGEFSSTVSGASVAGSVVELTLGGSVRGAAAAAAAGGGGGGTLERYLNDSLHAWFRQEFLMEYESQAGRLLCMVCGAQLPSLHLDHIKSHVLDTHPGSLVYSSEEKHCILQAWAQAHGHVELYAQDAEEVQINADSYPQSDGTLTQDTCLIDEDGGVAAPLPISKLPCQPRRKRPHATADLWQLRLDYLVAYGPHGQDTYCMVCSQVLHETKVSSFRRHIQECHPETTALSQKEREAMAAAWTKDYSSENLHIQDGEIELYLPWTAMKMSFSVIRIGFDGSVAYKPLQWTPENHPTLHYPGKDQRRNYQIRWRMEYLMDYDSRRHGLICIVCGATLATLKVSTIKRHIQQVHPHSLQYGPEQKQQTLLSYDQRTLHFVLPENAFSSSSSKNPADAELDPDPERPGT